MEGVEIDDYNDFTPIPKRLFYVHCVHEIKILSTFCYFLQCFSFVHVMVCHFCSTAENIVFEYLSNSVF